MLSYIRLNIDLALLGGEKEIKSKALTVVVTYEGYPTAR